MLNWYNADEVLMVFKTGKFFLKDFVNEVSLRQNLPDFFKIVPIKVNCKKKLNYKNGTS
jgi:hypothetical protein